MIYSFLDNQKEIKTFFPGRTLFKLEENSRTFQGNIEFNEFSRTSPNMQGLFKTVQTLFL